MTQQTPLPRDALDPAPAARWADALDAAELLALDPAGLGGAVLRGAPGPARDAWLSEMRSWLSPEAPLRRMPASIEDDRLLGGLDLAATLSLKRPVVQSGLLAEADGGLVVIPGAERMSAGMAARIAGAMKRREIVLERDGLARRLPSRFGIVMLDEGASDTECAPAALVERCAFLIDTDTINVTPRGGERPQTAALSVDEVEPVSEEMVAALTATAATFGIGSLLAVFLAMRAAVAAAARDGRNLPTVDDVAIAARLVLAPRATRMPVEDEATDQPEDSPSDPETPQEESEQPIDPAALQKLEDMIREAVQTALPADLLKQLESGKTSRGGAKSAGGGGKLRKSPLRGRPLGSRAGTLRPGARLALVDTLRAAAPWQGLRRTGQPADIVLRIQVRPGDFRIKRFAERREATIVFCVDASGSAAFHRLAEAKGAVELLLAEAYVARTHAALVVFRGTTGELLLPPTRSVARARALLADLPGGGGTPLATGLDAALLVALSERAKGRDPMLVVLTDGSANIARDGTPSRARAGAEGLEAARRISDEGIAAVFIDNAPRPRPEGSALAAAMGARFVALPYLEATAMRDAVRGAAADAARR